MRNCIHALKHTHTRTRTHTHTHTHTRTHTHEHKKLFPEKFKTCGKSNMISLKPQNISRNSDLWQRL
jgi:hypothetical protein